MWGRRYIRRCFVTIKRHSMTSGFGCEAQIEGQLEFTSGKRCLTADHRHYVDLYQPVQYQRSYEYNVRTQNEYACVEMRRNIKRARCFASCNLKYKYILKCVLSCVLQIRCCCPHSGNQSESAPRSRRHSSCSWRRRLTRISTTSVSGTLMCCEPGDTNCLVFHSLFFFFFF